MTEKQHILRTLAILTTIMLVDFMGLFMVAPLFTPILLSKTGALLSISASSSIRHLSVGLLIAMYGLGQFFGGPILGDLSDQAGRKSVLLLGVTIFILANLLSVLAIYLNNLFILFASRLICGFASGNATVLFAAASDMSDDTQRGTLIGYLVAAASIGATIGPLFGTYTSHFHNHTNLSLPFVILAAISVLNLVLLFGLFKNTQDLRPSAFRPFIIFKNIRDAFGLSEINLIILSFLCFVLGTESLFIGLPIYCVDRFHASAFFLAKLFGWGGFCSAISSWLLNKQLGKYLNAKHLYLLASIFLVIGYLCTLIPTSLKFMYLPYTLITLTCVLVWARGNNMVAAQVPANLQGKFLGVMQAMVSAAIFFGPLTVAFLAIHHYNFPILFSAGCGIISILIMGFARSQ